ncbi:bifunctional enoyl-CoA hydratase/phosphate acetyltransferase [Desulfovibrio gilichinskyi]|uniref:Phosphate butyryltransferase n=1 Tax=Desulfovibrio gilichinskyi TaxID=1519643 RepID=A0A1X7CXH8_9BACT|nr:bifunctional enoyl-CoA hydratase/phosphate acetyltransferase [Desulfovibrio gilichinskyi]SMF04751.1 phosphate butyryltransferase [Desulfovibrio gilichinskyi]
MTITSLDELIKNVRRCGGKPKVAIAPCAEEFVIRSAIEANEAGIAEPIFIGNREKAAAVSKEYGLNIDGFDFYEENDDAAAVAKAVQLFKDGKAALIMKGLVSTSVVLKAILNKETGVPTKGIISHVAVFESSESERLILITDAGVNIKPNLQRKADIIRNALQVARKLGIQNPKVAVLAAIEKVNYPAMPATLDADILAKMSVEGAFGDAFVAGPLALDIAISPSAAARKGVTNLVAGHADILCTPDIESGNILYKALSTIAGKCMASVVVGSDIPVVVPSRGDSDRSKFVSIALASYLTYC